MTNNSLYTRRRLLQVTGSTGILGFAGCIGTQSDGEQAGSGATETSTEAEHDEEDYTDEDSHDEEDDHDETEATHDDEDGDHDEEHGHGSVGEPTETARVAVNTTDTGEAHFSPHVTRVENGGTVTWVLESGSHTATAYHPENGEPRLVPDGADSWDSGTLSEVGETFEHTFETEGVYHYYCIPHETGGMIASVIVGEPDAHGQPALEAPPEDKPVAVREKMRELNEMCNEALGHQH